VVISISTIKLCYRWGLVGSCQIKSGKMSFWFDKNVTSMSVACRSDVRLEFNRSRHTTAGQMHDATERAPVQALCQQALGKVEATRNRIGWMLARAICQKQEQARRTCMRCSARTVAASPKKSKGVCADSGGTVAWCAGDASTRAATRA
jgi:hypothetical protein